MIPKTTFALSVAAIALAGAAPAHAAWQPQKPIEFVATAGPGGGTDNLARAILDPQHRACHAQLVQTFGGVPLGHAAARPDGHHLRQPDDGSPQSFVLRNVTSREV